MQSTYPLLCNVHSCVPIYSINISNLIKICMRIHNKDDDAKAIPSHVPRSLSQMLYTESMFYNISSRSVVVHLSSFSIPC